MENGCKACYNQGLIGELIMLSTLILVPAYGRVYNTVESAMTDWKDGRNFRLIRYSRYTSIRELQQLQAQLCTIYIRLENLKVSITVSNHH